MYLYVDIYQVSWENDPYSFSSIFLQQIRLLSPTFPCHSDILTERSSHVLFLGKSWKFCHLYTKLHLPVPRRLCFHCHLFACLLTGLHNKYLDNFHEIWWKGGTVATGGTRAVEETVRFWWWSG